MSGGGTVFLDGGRMARHEKRTTTVMGMAPSREQWTISTPESVVIWEVGEPTAHHGVYHRCRYTAAATGRTIRICPSSPPKCVARGRRVRDAILPIRFARRATEPAEIVHRQTRERHRPDRRTRPLAAEWRTAEPPHVSYSHLYDQASKRAGSVSRKTPPKIPTQLTTYNRRLHDSEEDVLSISTSTRFALRGLDRVAVALKHRRLFFVSGQRPPDERPTCALPQAEPLREVTQRLTDRVRVRLGELAVLVLQQLHDPNRCVEVRHVPGEPGIFWERLFQGREASFHPRPKALHLSQGGVIIILRIPMIDPIGLAEDLVLDQRGMDR